MVPARFMAIALPHCLGQLRCMVAWAFRSKEYYNHSYHLTDLSRCYLAEFVATISGVRRDYIDSFLDELNSDQELREELRGRAATGPDRHNSDAEPRFGRRLGWYALVRATKPRLIVETGVDRGLGTAVLAAAVLRNELEGYPGKVVATDINPACGHLVIDRLAPFVEIQIGDSVELLNKLTAPVDIFIHDSDHRPEYEWSEFLAVEPRLHADSIVMSDNSQQSSKCMEFARRLGKSFLYFQDQPKDHWWPGDGIGAAFRPGPRIQFQGKMAIGIEASEGKSVI